MRAALFALCFAGAVSAVTCAVSCTVTCAVSCADWALVEEHYYALALGGHPCGRSLERVEKDGERLRTISRIEMRFSRLGQETAIELSSEFIESARGEPIEATVAQKGAERVRYVFESPKKARVERGAVRETREIADDSWLTPREVAAFVAARGGAKAEEIHFRTLDVQSGFVVADISMKRLGEVERTIDGHSAKLVRYEVRNSMQPIVATELYDATGLLLESTTPIGLGNLVSLLSTKAAADENYANASFDLLAGTFVASRPIVRYLARGTIEFDLDSSAATMPELPSEGAQAFTKTGERSARVSVDVNRSSGAQPSDASDPRWNKPNELIDSDSKAVIELLASAKLPANASDFAKANDLRALVSRHIRSKNLATAFGSASEAARTRSGDCTEHAVLLAALCRAAGIPSRVASGLVYVPDLGGVGHGLKGPGWGWHLWTQVLVEPPIVAGGGARGWVDFDATVGGDGRGYHSAHILVATSDLAGGATDPAFSRALSLIGAVKISEVVQPGAVK